MPSGERRSTPQPTRSDPRAVGLGRDVSNLPRRGLKLTGFAIWERRVGAVRNVTFPVRQYSVNSECRSFAFLRPIADATAPNAIRDLDAYAEYEASIDRS
jgi:hypothetical protein